jgi:Tat protein translocase TatB subunit
MFGVGMPELMIIFVIALLVFGPKELPKIAKTLGKAMSELRRASDDLRDGIQREIEAATREEKETPVPSPEPVSSGQIAEGSSPAEATQGSLGTGGLGPETTAVEGGPAVEPASQEVAGSTPPASDVQSDQPVASQTVSSLEPPAEPGQPHVAHEEVMRTAEQAVPAESPKEPPPLPKTVPHVAVQPAETRNA